MSNGSVEDWAAKCARRIKDEPRNATEDRIAAIIATFAEPLMALLRESKREHCHCDDSWYCCGQCNATDHFLDEGEVVGANGGRPETCSCGADEWNARLDKVLEGL